MLVQGDVDNIQLHKTIFKDSELLFHLRKHYLESYLTHALYCSLFKWVYVMLFNCQTVIKSEKSQLGKHQKSAEVCLEI